LKPKINENLFVKKIVTITNIFYFGYSHLSNNDCNLFNKNVKRTPVLIIGET